MEAAANTTEMTVLGLSVILLLVQVAAQAFASYDLGADYLLGPRDEERQRNVLAGRLRRALANLLETYPAFVALALALVVTGHAGGMGAAGAWIWLGARIVYLIVYASGTPVVRSVAWFVALIGLCMMLFRFFA
ncbi:MAG: MAPEG family protein [Rhizobiaceae bacterium]